MEIMSWNAEPPWEAEDEDWRGDEHLADWPEHLAGPEYWMYKTAAEGGCIRPPSLPDYSE